MVRIRNSEDTAALDREAIDMYGFVDMSLVSTTYPYVLIAELRYAEESVTTACRVTRRLEKNE